MVEKKPWNRFDRYFKKNKESLEEESAHILYRFKREVRHIIDDKTIEKKVKNQKIKKALYKFDKKLRKALRYKQKKKKSKKI